MAEPVRLDVLEKCCDPGVQFFSTSGQPIARVATCTSACTTTSIRWSVSTAGLPPDYYRITATPTDRAGNRGPASPAQVLFIMEPPPHEVEARGITRGPPTVIRRRSVMRAR